MSEHESVGYVIQVVEASGNVRVKEFFLKKDYKDPGYTAHHRAASLSVAHQDCSVKVFAVARKDLPAEGLPGGL